MIKTKLIEQYTEENYSIEELIKIMAEKMKNGHKKGIYIEFITQKPVFNDKGKIIGVTTDFPAELNIYKPLN